MEKTVVKENLTTDLTSVTTRTITERADTLVTIQADTLIGKSDNLSEQPIIEFKDGLELIVKEDKVTHKVTATATKQPVKFRLNVNREIVENEDKHIHTKTDGFKEVVDKQVERTGGLNWNYLFWLLLLLLIPIWKYRKWFV